MTTGRPAARADLDQLPGRIESADQFHHHVHVGLGDEAFGVAGEKLRGQARSARRRPRRPPRQSRSAPRSGRRWRRPRSEGVRPGRRRRCRPPRQPPERAGGGGWQDSAPPSPARLAPSVHATAHHRRTPANPTGKGAADQPSRRTRSSLVSRRTTTRASPSATKTTAGRGTLL